MEKKKNRYYFDKMTYQKIDSMDKEGSVIYLELKSPYVTLPNRSKVFWPESAVCCSEWIGG
jgi:hypothetical protein